MNTEISKVQTWLLANKLSVHYVDKSQYMLVNKKLTCRVYGDFELKMGGHVIERTKTYRYLGIIVDEKFSWSDHINEVCFKLSQIAGVIFKVRHVLNKQALMLLYHGLVGSKLRYGLICWATANKLLLGKINVAHNNIVTLMTFQKRCSELWPLYCQLKVLPLNILIKMEHGKLMYKYNHNMLPSVFKHYIKKPTHIHYTRFADENKLARISINTSKEESMLKFLGPKRWISIPLSIKQSLSLKVFIKSYRIHLLGNFESIDNFD